MNSIVSYIKKYGLHLKPSGKHCFKGKESGMIVFGFFKDPSNCSIEKRLVKTYTLKMGKPVSSQL